METLGAQLEDAKAEAEDWREKYEEAINNPRLQELEKEVVELGAEVVRLRAALDGASTQLEEAGAESARLRDELGGLADEKGRLNGALTAATAENDGLREVADRVTAMEAELAEAKAEAKAAEKAAKAADKAMEKPVDEEALLKKLAQKDRTIAAMESALEQARDGLEQMADSKQHEREQVEDHRPESG